jgi:hypothetical protein
VDVILLGILGRILIVFALGMVMAALLAGLTWLFGGSL